MEKLTRRTARENAFLAAFASTFDNAMPEDVIALNNELGENRVDEFGRKLINDYYEHSAEINDMIRDHLKGWTIDRIPRVSLTVLRLALSEILYGDEKLPSVTINEAVVWRIRTPLRNNAHTGHRYQQLCNLFGRVRLLCQRGCLR